MLDCWVTCQVVCNIWEADNVLDQIRAVTTCFEGTTDNASEVETAPTRLLAGFDDDCVA